MTRLKRGLAAAAVPLLLALSLSACGDDDTSGSDGASDSPSSSTSPGSDESSDATTSVDPSTDSDDDGDDTDVAPGDADAAAFCQAFVNPPKGLESTDPGEQVDAAHEWADALSDVGTPSEITGDAREGFEIFVDKLADIDTDEVAELEGSQDPADVFGADDAPKVTAFVTQLGTLCASALSPDQLPTE